MAEDNELSKKDLWMNYIKIRREAIRLFSELLINRDQKESLHKMAEGTFEDQQVAWEILKNINSNSTS